jgi:tRNA G10  N-methylase Trm11
MNDFAKIKSLVNESFGDNIKLLPSVTELFELELAHLEYNCLPKEQLLERTAYIKSVDNKYSHHYTLYSNNSATIHSERSSTTKAYFEEGQFSTGYATHGLFPYRGKFHPQLIKALLNILGVQKGELVLDPMAGSGTTNVEAALLGINSIAIDVSPFCQFMIKTKYEALTIDLHLLNNTSIDCRKLFEFFKQGDIFNRISGINDNEKKKIYNLSFLAYLDAMGYSKRVVRSNHEQLFNKVLRRYLDAVKSFIANSYFIKEDLGSLDVLCESEALNIELKESSIDCVITSPPYSFAIDYVENDKDQLEFLGYDINELKKKLIGLKGKSKTEKLENYFSDMEVFCQQVSNVLKKGKHFVLIIGSNTNQTGGIRLEEKVINSAKKFGMPLKKSILKPIKGMRNTMKDEHLLIFEKQ